MAEEPENNTLDKKGWNSVRILTIVVLLLVVAFAAWKLFDVANEAPRGEVVELITKGNIEENQRDIAQWH